MRKNGKGKKAGDEGTESALAKRQAIEHENLDHAILAYDAALAAPLMPRLGAEEGRKPLWRQHTQQYDDAKNVRRMLDKIEGPARPQVRRDDGGSIVVERRPMKS